MKCILRQITMIESIANGVCGMRFVAGAVNTAVVGSPLQSTTRLVRVTDCRPNLISDTYYCIDPNPHVLWA
jgi:hypothetical protein